MVRVVNIKLGFTYSLFCDLIIPIKQCKFQHLNLKNVPYNFLQALASRVRLQNFNTSYLTLMAVGACQSFHFFRQTTWFLGNNRALSKFLFGILYYLISYQIIKKLVYKSQIYINRASCLKNKAVHVKLREKCPNMEFFWSVFSCIQPEYSKISTRKNSVFGHFSRSVIQHSSY